MDVGKLECAERLHIDKLRERLQQLDCKTPLEQELRLEVDPETQVSTLWIRSGARNALSGRMMSQLVELLDELERQPPRALLIQGHANTFCSGSDLVAVRQASGLGLELAQVMQHSLMRLQRLPLVSAAFVEGYALGGGAELALAADLRLMTEDAKLAFVHAKVGICCGWGGGTRLVQLLGPARALDLLASGRQVNAQEALQLGLSNGTLNSRQQALDYLGKRALGPPDTTRALKAMLNAARLLAPREALLAELQLGASTWGQAAHLRALGSNMKHRE